jgi:hypothetical protein
MTEYISTLAPHATPKKAYVEQQRNKLTIGIDPVDSCIAPKLPRHLLPGHPRAAPADRPGPARGGDGGLRSWGVDPFGRRPGADPGHRLGYFLERGLADLRRPGRGGDCIGHSRLGHVAFSYVYLDATYLHVRDSPRVDLPGQVVSKAVVVATGITATGGREVLGLAVGDSEEETFWRAFLTDLKARGLTGVRLVISDQQAGLVAALPALLPGRRPPALPRPLRSQPAPTRPRY